MYTEPPTTFDALLAPYPEQVREVAIWVRDLGAPGAFLLPLPKPTDGLARRGGFGALL